MNVQEVQTTDLVTLEQRVVVWDIEKFETVPGGAFVRLLDSMGGDDTIVSSARVSFRQKGSSPPEKLISYLWKNGHTSPFEHVVLRFDVRCPLSMARQWMRHRTQSYNEESARYVEPLPHVHVPATFLGQSRGNKQSGAEPLNRATNHFALTEMLAAARRSWETYKHMIDLGVSREDARLILPQGMMVSFVTTVNLLNLFRFLQKRLDVSAQWQTRLYAQEMLSIATEVAPIAVSAFKEHPL